jgi:SAM-dependent methyltransferase
MLVLMSSAPSYPVIFDRALVRRNLMRAHQQGFVDFLSRQVADELRERLALVLRDFSLVLDLNAPDQQIRQVLEQHSGIERVIRAASSLRRGVDLVADEESLPFAPQVFDAVISSLSLQHVNDLPGVLAQMRAILKPDGLFIGCLLGGDTLKELRNVLMDAETELEGGIAPHIAPFADVRAMGGLLQRAGFALPVVDQDVVSVRYPHALALMRDLRGMGLGNALRDRRMRPLRRSTLMRALALYQERFAGADGRVRATFELIWLSGWAPHDSQQKPLKPGSAQKRLAEALGTVEH